METLKDRKVEASSHLFSCFFLLCQRSTCLSDQPILLQPMVDQAQVEGVAPAQLLLVPPLALPGRLQDRLHLWQTPGYAFLNIVNIYLGGLAIPSHEPSGLKTPRSKRSRKRTRTRANGKGTRRSWNWAKSGLSSKSAHVMFGGSHMEGDQKAAARDAIPVVSSLSSTRDRVHTRAERLSASLQWESTWICTAVSSFVGWLVKCYHSSLLTQNRLPLAS